MQRYFGIAQTLEGQAVPSATIRVRLAGTATDATLYSDTAYTPLANPFTSEVDGAYQFYARDGRYDIVVTKTGYTFDNDDTADVLLADNQSVISPAQITANQNDYAPTNAVNASIWRLNTDAIRVITGIVAPTATGATSGLSLRLVNVGSFDFILSNQDSASAAANRIITVNGSLVVSPDDSVELLYDNTTTRWRVVRERAADAILTLNKTTGPGTAVTGNTLSNIVSVTIPGYTLQSNRGVRVTAFGSLTTASASQTATVTLSYGGTTVASAPGLTGIIAGTTPMIFEAWLHGNGSSTAQFGTLRSHGEDQYVDGGLTGKPIVANGSITAEDSNADQTLLLTWQIANATSTAIFTPQNSFVEWIR